MKYTAALEPNDCIVIVSLVSIFTKIFGENLFLILAKMRVLGKNSLFAIKGKFYEIFAIFVSCQHSVDRGAGCMRHSNNCTPITR